MMKRCAVWVIAVLALAAVPGWSAEDTPSDPAASVEVQQALRLFEAWADADVAYGKIPGVSVGLVVDRKLVWAKGLGYADLTAHRPATPETIYGICSISKLFTSIAVMQERDAGKLRLDDPVSRYLPYVALPPAGNDVAVLTIDSLLTHSSGLPREAAAPYWTGPGFTFPTQEEIVAGLRGQKMLYPPERHYQYSNLGLTLAGEIVEKVSGEAYRAYVEDAILKPLGLPHTTPYLPGSERGKLLATGYGRLTREGTRDVMPFYDARGITPATGFASNVDDLAAFVAWQFRLLDGENAGVLKASTLRDMQRPHWVDSDWDMGTTRGLGFGIYRHGDDTLVGHTGECPGYFTTIRMDLRRRVGAVVLTNGMDTAPEKIARQLLDVVRPALADAKAAEKAGRSPQPPDADLERYAGLYRSAWGETVVVPWKEGLAAVGVPTDDLAGDLVELKPTGPQTFRRIREDGDDLGEEIRFESGADGTIVRMKWFENYSEKVR